MNVHTIVEWVAVAVLIYGAIAVGIGAWALATHREKLYRERKATFDAQLDRVSKRITRNHL
jgi:hypothetical protein